MLTSLDRKDDIENIKVEARKLAIQEIRAEFESKGNKEGLAELAKIEVLS